MNKVVPHFFVENVGENIIFYKSLLGFRLSYVQPEGGEPNFAVMNFGDAEIMFGSRETLAQYLPEFKDKPLESSTIYYFEMEDVDEYFETVRSKVNVIKELSETWYHTKEFWLKDCNGYIIAFYENL